MNDLMRRWKGKQAASVAGNSSKTLFTDRKGGMCDEVVWICRILIMIQPLQTKAHSVTLQSSLRPRSKSRLRMIMSTAISFCSKVSFTRWSVHFRKPVPFSVTHFSGGTCVAKITQGPMPSACNVRPKSRLNSVDRPTSFVDPRYNLDHSPTHPKRLANGSGGRPRPSMLSCIKRLELPSLSSLLRLHLTERLER